MDCDSNLILPLVHSIRNAIASTKSGQSGNIVEEIKQE